MGVYARPSAEYVQPEGRMELLGHGHLHAAHRAAQDDLDPADACCLVVAVRGTDFNDRSYQKRGKGIHWFEVVPEPGNPHDPLAVALDLDGKRIGYLPARLAPYVQWRVGFLNRRGYACFVPGEYADGAYYAIPTLNEFDKMVAPSQLFGEMQYLYNELSESSRNRIERETGFHIYDDEIWREIESLAHHAPSLLVPPMWRSDRSHPLFDLYLRELRSNRSKERDEARARKRVEEEAAKELRRVERDRAREALDAEIERRVRSGGSNAAIARELGVSASRVGQIRKTNDAENLADWLEASARRDRIRVSSEALALQRSGMPRREIAVGLGIGVERVKVLLALARFLEAPDKFPGRLALARRAGRESWTKSTAPRGVMYRRAMTDWADLQRSGRA